LLYILKNYSNTLANLKTITNTSKKDFLNNTNFVNKYYYLNDLLWQEGFLIDFVQKKTTDKLIRKFLILSAYLFSERLIFDKLIRIYSDVIMLLSTYKSIYEFNNVANVIFTLVFMIALLLLTITLLFMCQIHLL